MDWVCNDVWCMDGNARLTPGPKGKPPPTSGKLMLTSWKSTALAVSWLNATVLLDCTMVGKPNDVGMSCALAPKTKKLEAAANKITVTNLFIKLSTLLYHGAML